MLDLLYALTIHLSCDVAINELIERQQRLRPLLIRVPGAHLHGNGPTPGHRPQVLDAWWEERRRTCLKPSKRKSAHSGFDNHAEIHHLCSSGCLPPPLPSVASSRMSAVSGERREGGQ